ncbi:MAG: DUF1924 domain-containing protein [Burkholderiaceae bacterium]|nr:DUF1924 domain-containing protein [Burkholderiaceae bacterium]
MRVVAAVMFLVSAPSAGAETWRDLLQGYRAEAAGTPGFTEFSAARGRQLFADSHGRDWRCSSCHTDDPRAMGRHEVTGKSIQPLAPIANAARFTSPRKVEKWFRRNCRDVLGRECTAREKGDLISYLTSLGGERQ